MASTFKLYGQKFSNTAHPLAIEMDCIKMGGRWRNQYNENCGNGLFFHYKRGISLLWPEIVWHKWNELFLEKWIESRSLGVLGPASSGKTNSAAIIHLFDWYCFPSITTVILCSTTRERLEDRVWGETKKYHKMAMTRAAWLNGHLIEGRQRILLDDRGEAIEGRDFRNGLIGVPCKKGESWVGLGDFAGIKNKRVRLLADEASLLPRAFADSVSNLDKNPDFKLTALGNPKDTTDTLGLVCEPAAHLGGWEGGIDQTPITKSWETRRPGGIALQFPGEDSPNKDGRLGIPIITQEQIDRDVAFYGRDSLWFSMMNAGMMPRGQGSRRVLTRQMCLKFRALEEPIWKDSGRTKIGFLDAAYRGVGGDRCIFGELDFGNEAYDLEKVDPVSALISQVAPNNPNRHIVALIDLLVVPINVRLPELPEDQIVNFVRQECEQRGIAPNNFFFDSGMRSSLVTAFGRIWSPQVNGIDCGGSPSERKVSYDIDVLCCNYYSKFITELWYSVRLAVEAGQFRGLTEEAMLEFCNREWKIVGKNKIEVENKEDCKLKNGRSPDLADAIAIGVEGARQRGFVIRRLKPTHGKPHHDSWKLDLKKRAHALNTGQSLNYTA